MEMLWHYQLTGNLTNQNAGYSMWGFAKLGGKDFFVKQFLSPKYPEDDHVSSPERIEKKKAECRRFEERKKRIYHAVNQFSDGNDVRIYEFFRVKSKYYISMEKIESLEWSVSDIAALPEQEKRRLCGIISHSISALHGAGIVHADIKHENVLFTKTPANTVTAKIIDFDSVFLESEPPGEGEDVVGDWAYFPPEVWLRMDGTAIQLNSKIDIFALGILFHQYFSGEYPAYDTEQFTSVGQALLYGGEVILSDYLPEYMKALIREMLQTDPELRPTAAAVFSQLQPDLPIFQPITPEPVPEFVDYPEEQDDPFFRRAFDL